MGLAIFVLLLALGPVPALAEDENGSPATPAAANSDTTSDGTQTGNDVLGDGAGDVSDTSASAQGGSADAAAAVVPASPSTGNDDVSDGTGTDLSTAPAAPADGTGSVADDVPTGTRSDSAPSATATPDDSAYDASTPEQTPTADESMTVKPTTVDPTIGEPTTAEPTAPASTTSDAPASVDSDDPAPTDPSDQAPAQDPAPAAGDAADATSTPVSTSAQAAAPAAAQDPAPAASDAPSQSASKSATPADASDAPSQTVSKPAATAATTSAAPTKPAATAAKPAATAKPAAVTTPAAPKAQPKAKTAQSTEAVIAAAVARVASTRAHKGRLLVPDTNATTKTLLPEAVTPKTFLVRFYDAFGNVIKKARVKSGGKAAAPKSASMKAVGRTFKGWDVAFSKVTRNLFVHPIYVDKNKTYIYSWSVLGQPDDVTMWFRRKAGTTLSTSNVYVSLDGVPFQEGMEFIGWNTKPDGSGTFYEANASFKAPSRDTGFFACFKKYPAGTVTLTLNSNADDVYDVETTVAKGVPMRLAETGGYNACTNQGYTLVGYNTKADGTGKTYKLSDKIKLTKNTTLYGVWKKATSALVVDDNYAGGKTTVTYLTGGGVYVVGAVTNAVNTYRDGYELMGFNTRKDGKGTNYSVYKDAAHMQLSYSTLKMPTKGLKLYAQWKKNSAIVTVKPNYKGSKDADITYQPKYGRSVLLPYTPTITRKGYQLVGFNTKANGKGTAYGVGEQITPKKSMKLYAQWKKVNAKVTFVPNYKGIDQFTGKKAAKHTIKVTKGYDFQTGYWRPMYQRTGYRLTGWNTKADGSGESYKGNPSMFATSGKTLYAQWEKLRKMVLKPNYSGASSSDTNTIYFSAGDKITLKYMSMSRDGYSLAGYNTKANGTGKTYSLDEHISMPKRNLTLYACWKKNSANLKLVSLDDTATTQTFKVAPGVPLDRQSDVSYYAYTSKPGYDFAGWNTKKDGTGKMYMYRAFSSLKPSSKGMTLYAQWVKMPTVTYVANNGTSTKETWQSFFANLSNADFKKTGKAIYAWNTRADGKGTSYAYGTDINNIPKSLKFFAQWKTPTAKVTYKWRDDNGKLKTTTVGVIGGAYNGFSMPNPPDRKRVYLEGWYTKPNGQGEQYYTSTNCAYVPAKGLTLIANWAKKNTVTYRPNYSGSTSASVVEYVTPYTYTPTLLSTAFKRDEYYITSWNTKADGTGDSYNTYADWSISMSTDENVVLYAQWSKKPTLSIDYNGGTAATTVVKRSIPTYDSYEVSLSSYSSKAKRAGYSLVGWSTDKNATPNDFYYGTTSSFVWYPYSEDSSETLYAIWKPNEQ